MSKTKEDKDNLKSNNGENSKKKTIIIFAVIFLLIITIGIFFGIINYKKDITENKENSITNTNSGEEEGISLIDYENTNNIHIVDGAKKNNSKALLKNKEFKELDVKDIQLEAKDGVTNFLATIENNTDRDFESCIIKLVFINEDGTEYARLEGAIPDIKRGSKTLLDVSTTSDLSNAFDFKIEEI